MTRFNVTIHPTTHRNRSILIKFMKIKSNKKQDPKELAGRFIGKTKKPDITKIITSKGFTVGQFDSIDMTAYVIIDTKRKIIPKIAQTDKIRMIGVKQELDFETKVFLVAYEYGIYLYEYNNENIFAHGYDEDKINEKAYEFALYAIMPCDKFEKQYRDYIERKLSHEDIVTLLSYHFKTTRTLVQKRIELIKSKD